MIAIDLHKLVATLRDFAKGGGLWQIAKYLPLMLVGCFAILAMVLHFEMERIGNGYIPNFRWSTDVSSARKAVEKAVEEVYESERYVNLLDLVTSLQYSLDQMERQILLEYHPLCENQNVNMKLRADDGYMDIDIVVFYQQGASDFLGNAIGRVKRNFSRNLFSTRQCTTAVENNKYIVLDSHRPSDRDRYVIVGDRVREEFQCEIFESLLEHQSLHIRLPQSADDRRRSNSWNIRVAKPPSARLQAEMDERRAIRVGYRRDADIEQWEEIVNPQEYWIDLAACDRGLAPLISD